MRARIGLVGDHDPSVTAHRAIPLVLERAAAETGVDAAWEWCPTDTLNDDVEPRLAQFDALWCVPASPYRSTDGAIAAIRFARTRAVPFLGTCGGFQHALLEYARSVRGMDDASHAELEPRAAAPLIAPLSCALVERRGNVRILPGTRLLAIYGTSETDEGYHCSYGLDPSREADLFDGSLVVSARDLTGEVRAVELREHPFFVATLYQPERRGLEGRGHPIVNAFVEAAARSADI